MHVTVFWRGVSGRAAQAVYRDRALAKAVAAVTFAALISVAFASMNRGVTAPKSDRATPVKSERAATLKPDRIAEILDEPVPGELARGRVIPDEPADDEIWPPIETFSAVQPQPASLKGPKPSLQRSNTGLAPALHANAPTDDSDSSTAKPTIPESAAAPTACLPEPLKAVLRDLMERFPGTTVVSTTHLHTDNHSRGSARARMHSDCRAVDVKTKSNPREVIAFLKRRSEVGGVNTYRNKVVHFDLAAGYSRKRFASRRARR